MALTRLFTRLFKGLLYKSRCRLSLFHGSCERANTHAWCSESRRTLLMTNRIKLLPHDNTWRPLQQIAAICREYLQRWNNNLQVVKVWLEYSMKTFNGLDQTMGIGWVVQSPTIGIQRFKDYCTNRYSCIATHYWEFSSICIVWETTTTLQQSVYMQFNGQANKESFKGASINNYQNYRCSFRVYLFVSQKTEKRK